MINLMLVDQNSTIRLGIRSLLNRYCTISKIDDVSEVNDLMGSLLSKDYELLIIEPVVNNEADFSVIRRVTNIRPDLNVLVLTELDDRVCGEMEFRYGAKGILSKSCSGAELAAAVRRVAKGRNYVSEALADELVLMRTKGNEIAPHLFLSARETQVFSLLIYGKSTTEIAKILGLSSKTASTHKARLLVKLGMKSISEIVQYAISRGLLEAYRADGSLLVANRGADFKSIGCVECT